MLAIMFAKLGMSVEEAWQEFSTICQIVYKTSQSKDRRTAILREAIEGLLKRRGFAIDVKLRNDERQSDNFCQWYAPICWQSASF
jgi:hypothetical protein